MAAVGESRGLPDGEGTPEEALGRIIVGVGARCAFCEAELGCGAGAATLLPCAHLTCSLCTARQCMNALMAASCGACSADFRYEDCHEAEGPWQWEEPSGGEQGWSSASRRCKCSKAPKEFRKTSALNVAQKVEQGFMLSDDRAASDVFLTVTQCKNGEFTTACGRVCADPDKTSPGLMRWLGGIFRQRLLLLAAKRAEARQPPEICKISSFIHGPPALGTGRCGGLTGSLKCCDVCCGTIG